MAAPSSATLGAASRRRALVVLAVVSATLVAMVYAIAVRTTWGQRVDAAALSGRDVLDERAIHAAERVLSTIDVASMALVGTAIVLVALARGRPRLALGAGVVIAGSVVTSELLKHVLLGRPDLGVVDALGSSATYPSGHTTVAMTLGVAATLVAPKRWRLLVALVAIAYASAMGLAVIATANHRPSDPIGAALVVAAWAAAIAALLVGSGQRGTPERAAWATPGLLAAGSVLVIVGAAGLAMTVAAMRHDELGTVELGGAFLAAAAAIVGTIVVAVSTLVVLLGDDELA